MATVTASRTVLRDGTPRPLVAAAARDRRRARPRSASTRSSSRRWATTTSTRAGGAHYLSPFYSPDLQSCGTRRRRSPYAFLVIWVPLGFRAHVLLLPQGVLPGVLPRAAGLRGRRAPRGAATAARRRCRSSCRTCTATSCYLATIVLGFLWYDAIRAFFFRRDGRSSSASASARWCCSPTWSLLSLFTFGCNSVRHLVGGRLDCFTCSRRARGRATGCGAASACSTAGTWSGPGSASSGSASPTSTSGSRRPASSTTRGSSDVRSSATTTTWS